MQIDIHQKESDLLVSPYHQSEIVEIITQEADRFPGVLRLFLTLDAARYVGTSRVCALIGETSFELRNRVDPFLSLRALCELHEHTNGTLINICWSKPAYFGILNKLLLKKHFTDRRVIKVFLSCALKAKLT